VINVIAVAKKAVMPMVKLRPHASAVEAMMPIDPLRSQSPAIRPVIPNLKLPGSHIPFAVAEKTLQPSVLMRPHASANMNLTPNVRVRSPSPASLLVMPQGMVPGSPIRIAVAKNFVKSMMRLRPRYASATAAVMPKDGLRSPSPANAA
jgi:hypothetical protein